ncbi:3-polyprenyl-4-hydroxybenzoate decarboxylase [Frankia casuarinae]|uniref:3-octaprenyl-4-hydroxybenzoate carboxy-lyase n=1 Tax=Frankia casuarinae (strain DSM 45818 / CECT 9043 / HFP020203 / CcI3) TaxID=106370 RepID=Q2JFP1_FRACC|nr:MULTISPECIES: UbiX family flavin prenyltransferase [Frankia]ABD09901.1 3-octaprenyl-4-hydroxybenzoate carboxy-lyase [Frankia casuarinae]EYT90208.1 3-polyprenyl-4-hydroxybenzoate decarboxylase [Frankia casuarinae]KDA44912.1 3-polyprenyl-4-hydroxybenzoate decarboxylase [Frankia sp. BMG5.23]TFE35438.1 UbiX family flavin prenyltransferase [Frankia sp. B2]
MADVFSAPEEGAGARLPWVVGVSGASGTPYAAAVLRGLLAARLPVDLVLSRAARLTLLDETGIAWRDSAWAKALVTWLSMPPGGVSPPEGLSARLADRDVLADTVSTLVAVHAPGDLGAPTSSGSYPTRGMIVVPASTACLAGITLGLSKDLLQRSADVTLKEGRRLIVVPREMPYTRATLRHMLDLHDAGAVVAAASPGFYAGVRTAGDLVDFVAGRVLDAADVPHTLFRRWTGELGGARRDLADRRDLLEVETAPPAG